mmetsp:Transcript_22102/g.70600  ORF Transcript_22102/g.70600 Transcript_22102/m.70600 type:complete len:216 (-) Transcript_22102:79-726(-)
MRANFALALGVLAGAATSAEAQDAESICKLTQKVPMKPEPSLTQCYRFNSLACCVSGHDSVIKEAYEETFSRNCLREYPLLENWFCLGCNPDEYRFVNADTATISVCREYATNLFALDLDKCGIKIGVSNPLVNKDDPGARWVVGSHNKSTDKQVVLPKLVFGNAADFLSHLLPPFYENYVISIVPDDGNCFSAAAHLRVSLWFVAAVLFATSVL